MLVLLSLLAAIGFAQNCDVGTGNPSQKRRACKKLPDCKWNSSIEDNGVITPGECVAATSCAGQTANKCKKRNTCFIDWADPLKPCLDYNPDVEMPCNRLSGKKNMEKCNKQDKCIWGSGDRANKECVPIPTDLQTRACETYNGKPYKYICKKIEKCTWVDRGTDAKKCVLKRKPFEKTCSTVTAQLECNNQPNGCVWTQNQCRELNCPQINDRMKCQKSDKGCQWAEGMHPGDYDVSRNKKDQKDALKNTLGARDGYCKNGIKTCQDIMVENFCILSSTKYGINGCHWNKEAKEMGRSRCHTTPPCSAHDKTNDNGLTCQSADNMNGGKCVWQKSGNVNRCMEFDCGSAQVQEKNKCNTVGCHWHRNKDKRDPLKVGYCGVLDFAKGRRL